MLNASLYGVIREAFRHPRIEEIYGARFGNEGLLAGNFADLRRQAAQKLDGLPSTPGSALGSSRRRIEPAYYEGILHQLRHQNIRFLLFNGGNGTMMLASEIARFAAAHGWEMRVMGIPKTVDNDIVLTDHCPGYGSAARYLAVTALELGLDNEALPFPVEILETIGRDTGWLAAATVLATRGPEEAAQVVYVPEIPFEIDRFLADVEFVYRRMGRVVAVVAEGVRNARGEPMAASSLDSNRDGFGRPLPGNVSAQLAELVGRELRLRVRNDKPGICARSSLAHVSSVDREEALRCGEFAVERALGGVSGMIVTLERVSESPYLCELGLAPLEDVACHERMMPREFMNDAGNFPTEAFRRYAAPLLGGELPAYSRLA